jgi:hypothetical protein
MDDLAPAASCRDLRPVVFGAVSTQPATAIEIHYGRRTRLDRIHANRVRRSANVELHAHDCEHNVAKALRDQGELRGVLERAVTGDPAAT